MKVAPPISRIAGNLVYDREGDVWAGFWVRTHSYRSEPERRKIAIATGLAHLAYTVEADFQVLRVSRSLDPDAYVDRVMGNASGRAHRGLLGRYVQGQRNRLKELESFSASTFVFVRLAEPEQDFQERSARLLERTPREILASLRANARMSSGEVEDRARTAEARVTSCLPGSRSATAAEIQWLVRRALCRGISEPRSAPIVDGRSIYRWLSEDRFRHNYREIRVQGEDGDSWQVGYVVGEVDDAKAFTRKVELMFTPLEDHPWPIDAALNVRYVRSDQAKRKLFNVFARKARQLEDEEAATSFGAMADSHHRVTTARDYHDRISQTGEPMLTGTLSFIVAAEDEPTARRRARAFRESYPWPLYRPSGDQLDVWIQHLPGQRPRVRGYERPWTPEQIGAMVPHATHDAGSRTDRSFYLGYTRRGRVPVFFDLREGSQTDKSSVIALLASQGSGKTSTLQLLMYQAFLQGSRIVDIDPKGDHRWHEMPEVSDHVRSIVLGPSPEHAGKLDPLRVAPVDERHDATATFLTDVLPPVGGDVEAAINEKIGEVMEQHGERACCWAVVDALRAGATETEQRAGRMLAAYANSGIPRLAFAHLDDPLPMTASEQITYLQIRSLKRAAVETVRSEMSQSQRHGRAILQLVALYAMRILGHEKGRHKVLAFDEASFLTQDAVGHQLIDTLNRWGRSEDATSLLSSQLRKDFEDLGNLIGRWLVFAMKDRDEARLTLRGLEMDDDGPLLNAVREEYEHGLCVFRDLYGRTEELQVDLGDLLEPLSTTPEEREPEPETEQRIRVVVP